ncbi:MAG: hypothetical protein KGH83_03780 [Thaumarchaeota archaeon]|nr:hypothetical protein [Nitrososphaerota archaeon]
MKFAVMVSIIVTTTFLGLIGTVYASPQISISTSKPVYQYGQSLSFSVTVSNVTGDMATLEIVDQSNQSSSPIDMMITKPVSNITAPVPFYKTTFAPGTYFVKIQYSGSNGTASFRLVDAGNIVIPPQFKEVASSWVRNQTSDRLFGENIFYLVNSGTIRIDGYHDQNMTAIPSWFKNDALWWSNGSISDNDFGHVVQYLLESKIMIV